MRFGEGRNTMQSRMEERLPFLSITLPENIRTTFQQLHENLKANTNRLFSPFDIHATLHHILNYPDNRPGKIGRSLFQAIPEDRSCSACEIPEHYFPCVQLQEIPTAHSHVHKAAEGLVAHINKILNGDKFAEKMCSTLKLGEVKSAYLNLNHPKSVKFLGSKDIDGRIPRFGNHTNDYEMQLSVTGRNNLGGCVIRGNRTTAG